MFFEVDGLKLTGNLVKGNRRKPTVFIIHGGGLQPNQASRFLEWQIILAKNNFGSFVFNHSGILPSEGEVKNATLELRLREARVALGFFCDLAKVKPQRLVIVGVSMGGHIAAQLASEVQSLGLVLCEPGSFVEDAENKPFGPIFSEVLRQEKNWKTVSTRSFNSVTSYQGHLLVVVPENDLVVPKEVPERYLNETRSARTKELHTLKDATHFYFRLNDPAVNPNWREDFYRKTLIWLQGIY